MRKISSAILFLFVLAMKWSSTLFSDLRNKLGNQIVGTSWKGRGVFRAYKVPANPNTLPQQAHRAVMSELVARYQSKVKDDADYEPLWNAAALDRLISGYNLFTKLGRENVLSVPATKEGASPQAITITYTVKTDLSQTGIMVQKPDLTFVNVAVPGTLEAGADKTKSYDATESGDYLFFMYDKRAKKEVEGTAEEETAYNHWKPDTATGVADPALCAVTIT